MTLASSTETPVKLPEVRLRVYHCGNWIGIWGPKPAAWWCRRCRRLIDSKEALRLLSR